MEKMNLKPESVLQRFQQKPFTDIFTNDTDIDRRLCRRTVPMKVLALALRIALKKLGYEDCYHMMSASVENPADCRLWQQAFAAKFDGIGSFGREEWDQLLGHCQALCDWPAIAFAKELVEAYPDAKVILTTRDVDSWHRSVLKTVDWRANDEELRVVSKVDYGAGLYQPMLRKFWDVFFDGRFAETGKAKFVAHCDEVRSLTNASNLLEYGVEMGWEPLCTFLGVPIPQEAFPHVNDGDHFVQRCKARNRAQMKNAALRYALCGAGLVIFATWGKILLHGARGFPIDFEI